MPMPDNPARKLVAIRAADIVGYSALMGVDQSRTVSDLWNKVKARRYPAPCGIRGCGPPICSRNVRRTPNASNFVDQADRERPLTLTLSSSERSSLLAATRDLFDLARVL